MRAMLTTSILALSLLLAGCGQDDADVATIGAGSPTGPGASAQGPYGDVDAMFATGMIPHHAQAVAMSRSVLAADGTSAEVRELAEAIRSAQAPEIELMRGWLADWGYPVPDADDTAPGDMTGMHHSGSMAGSMAGATRGMMDADDLEDLAAATGPAAERLFLRQMIVHHRGAVMMSRMQLRMGENPDARALARRIVDSQLAEIVTMRGLLREADAA